MTNNNAGPEMCIWTYQVRADAEDRFRTLLARHWPTLRRLGFVTDAPPQVFRGSEEPPVYVEILTWEAAGMRPAHEHPDVIAIWERMKAVVEERTASSPVPGMSFPFYQPVDPYQPADVDA